MITKIKRHFAVRAYVMRLSQALARRFGVKPFYTIEQTTQAVEKGKFNTEFIQCAHAIFCRQEDFDARYQKDAGAVKYLEFRRTIGRKFFGGAEFDATTVIRAFRSTNSDGHYESGIGGQGGQSPH